MNIKVLVSAVAFAVGGAAFGGLAHAATESTQTTTVERSKTTVEPKPDAIVNEERTTTTTKHGLFGRKKSETTTTTKSYERGADNVSNAEVKSRTTVETEKKY